MLLAALAQRIVGWGRLAIIDAHGRQHRIDNEEGPDVVVRLHDSSLHRRLITNPQLAIGEAYTDGSLTIARGSLYDFLEICALAELKCCHQPVGRSLYALGRLVRGLYQCNPTTRAQAHVVHHYDLSDELYALFLDADRQYSCGYFRGDPDDLDQA